MWFNTGATRVGSAVFVWQLARWPPRQEQCSVARFVPTSFASLAAAPALIWDGRREGEAAAIDYR